MSERELPATQQAIQFVGADEVRLNRSKPVPRPGPRQLLVQVEAVGICFSDTKLLHAFSSHPRKSEVLRGLDAEALAEIPSYVPGELPTVPGHEVCGRIVAVGPEVEHHRVGERVLVQTDYRHLPTAGANAAFGYDFEGGLQEYVLLDERVIMDPDTGERFLIPVSEEPSASAVGLLEPWACVERAYATTERATLRPDGRLLVVADEGHAVAGLEELLAGARPASVTTVLADDAQAAEVDSVADGSLMVSQANDLSGLGAGTFDDVIYYGADVARVTRLADLLAPQGILDIVLGGQRLGMPVDVDVGRIHYDLVRWVGTTGSSAAEGYAMAPGSGELRDGERVAIIGAAGPMGFMHVIRSVTAPQHDLAVTAIDIDAARLAHLARVAAPLAEARGVDFRALDGTRETPTPGYTRVGVMVPSPALAAQALELAGPGAIIDLFAGFAVGTRASLDVDVLIEKRAYLLGTSGSTIADMRAVLAKLEAGVLDTNISVDAVSGLEGVPDALAAVQARTSGGKIVIYPSLRGTGLLPLPTLPERAPDVAARLEEGRWTQAAESALLASAGPTSERRADG